MHLQSRLKTKQMIIIIKIIIKVIIIIILVLKMITIVIIIIKQIVNSL